MSVQCPNIASTIVISDEPRLAAHISTMLASRGVYLSILEQPRLTRPDREAEIIRCTNAIARSKATDFILAGVGSITSKALSASLPERKTVNIRTCDDLELIRLRGRKFKEAPLVWGNDRIGIGLLKALRERRQLIFNDDPSPIETIPPKNDHLVVCEIGDEIAEVIAANFAFATGAGLHLIPTVDDEIADRILECFYGINENSDVPVSFALAELRRELRELAGLVPVPRNGSMTFITRELPFGFAFPEVPTTHLFSYPDLGTSIVQGLSAGQQSSPGTRVATFVNPQKAAAPEIDAAISLLRPYGIYMRKYEGSAADVTSVSEMIELFPYDLLLIATHCGDVSGYRWTYHYEDSEGYNRILVVDIALGVGRTDDKDMLNVTEFMRFVSLDGVDWKRPAEKEKLYVGKAITSFMEQIRAKPELKPVKKETTGRVLGSAALAMADGNLIALPRSLAHENTPIVVNNACVSWHRLAKNFMFGGAKGYVGTLIPVTSAEAAAVVERMLGKHFGKPLPVALWAAQRDVYGADGRSPYVVMGVFPQKLRPSHEDAPRYIMQQLSSGLRTWSRMLEKTRQSERSRRRTMQGYVKYYERELAGYRDRWLPKRSPRATE